MRIVSLTIKNFKSIRSLTISDIENALIIVGKNSVGKTVILDAIRAVAGQYVVKRGDFNSANSNVEIKVSLEISDADLGILNRNGIVSHSKRYAAGRTWSRKGNSKTFCKGK